MPDFTQVHSQKWLEYFADCGYPGVTPLAAGVEGVTVALTPLSAVVAGGLTIG